MNEFLQDTLYAAYPVLFHQTNLPVTQSAMGRGLECGDGWFGILDALCVALTTFGQQPGRQSIAVEQVKEKFGGLRFHIDGACDWYRGAIDFSSAISRRVCVETGRPGILMAKGRSLRTLAEDVGRKEGYHCAARPELDPVHSHSKPGDDILPAGWESIGAALRSIIPDDVISPFIRLSRVKASLVVETTPKAEWLSGAASCAVQVAARTDPDSGAMVIPTSGRH